MLAPYAKMVKAIVASNITSLTAAVIDSSLDSKVNLADSGTIYITPLQLKEIKFDTTNLIEKINTKSIILAKDIANNKSVIRNAMIVVSVFLLFMFSYTMFLKISAHKAPVPMKIEPVPVPPKSEPLPPTPTVIETPVVNPASDQKISDVAQSQESLQADVLSMQSQLSNLDNNVNLTNLIFGCDFNQKISLDNNTNLTNLIFGYDFNQKISLDNNKSCMRHE